jgi:hypothetical protein
VGVTFSLMGRSCIGSYSLGRREEEFGNPAANENGMGDNCQETEPDGASKCSPMISFKGVV